MPFLDTIVGLINSGLKAGALSDKRFATAEINGIAMPVQRDKVKGSGKETIPCIWLGEGEVKYIGIDDTTPIMLYHKVTRSQTVPDQEANQFGDGRRRIKNTALLYLVVYADRSRVRLSPDELEALITVGLLDEIKKTQYPSTGFSSLVVTPGESNFNSGSIFSSEYPGADNFLKPESILFQVSYSVVSIFRKECLALCGC